MHLTKHDSLATPKYVSVSPMMMRMAMTMTNRPCEAAVGREAIRVYWLQESQRECGGGGEVMGIFVGDSDYDKV